MTQLLAITLSWLLMVSPSLAAIAFVNASVNSASPNGNFTNAIPTNCAAGNLMIVVYGVGDSSGADTDLTVDGFTEVADQANTADTADVEMFVGYRYMVGGDSQVPISGNFPSIGGTNASNAAVVMCFSGVAQAADGGPFDTAANQTNGNNTTNADPPSHNWSGTAGVWTVIACAGAHTGGATATFTGPTNYTTNFTMRNHDDNGTDVLVALGYRTNPADPEDPGACTAANIGTDANNSWAAATMSLKEAPAPTCTAGLNQMMMGFGGCP